MHFFKKLVVRTVLPTEHALPPRNPRREDGVVEPRVLVEQIVLRLCHGLNYISVTNQLVNAYPDLSCQDA